MVFDGGCASHGAGIAEVAEGASPVERTFERGNEGSLVMDIGGEQRGAVANVFEVAENAGTGAGCNAEHLLCFDAEFVVDSTAIDGDRVDGVETVSLGIASGIDAVFHAIAAVVDIAGNDDSAAFMEIFENVFDFGHITERAPAFIHKFIVEICRISGDDTGRSFEFDADGDKKLLPGGNVGIFTGAA